MMTKQKREYIESILKRKERELERLKQDHLTAIAVFEARRDMLTRDINTFESVLNSDTKK
jgi:hypothetical protein